MNPPTVVDHAGDRRPWLGAETLLRLIRDDRQRVEQTQRANGPEHQRRARRIGFWIVIVPGGTFLLIACVVGFLTGLGRSGVAVLLGIALLLWIGFVSAVSPFTRRQFLLSHRDTLLAFDLCGACGHPLQGLRPEATNLLRCPECGARWRSTK